MTPHVVTENGFEQQFQVNHLSHFLLFQLLKDILIASSTPSLQSRVIAVASSIHTFGPVLVGDYNMEKREGGYDPMYGARPLKRYLQKNVETLAARLILAGNVGREDTILIDVQDDKLTARVKEGLREAE